MRVERRLMAKKKSAAKKASVRKAAAKAKGPARRMAPVGAFKPEDLHSLLEVLKDKKKSIEERYDALQALGAAHFASPDFSSIHGDYIAALREVSSDADAELRQRALGVLSREKDGFAQKKLLDGLKNPEKAMVPPEKALQLLGSDIHADAYPVAREIVKKPPNPVARREALRLLASDASSARTFEKILQDKKESPEIRQVSAAALHVLNPEKLQEHARKILLDPSEHADMQQIGLTALTSFGKSNLGEDKQLIGRVNRMSTSGPAGVKKSARRFLGRFSS
jgi:hypothetical protein